MTPKPQTIKRKPISLTGSVTTYAAYADRSSRTFSINAYTGSIIDAYFGKLAFDISGMQSKPLMPILREHQRDRIVGFGEASQDGSSFTVNGKFSETTADGKECLSLADEGYPWQASVGIRPVRVRALTKNETMTVNGKELSGPAEVWLQSEVGEVSFVSLGADSNTSISVFSDTASEIEAELESSTDPETADTTVGQEEKIMLTKSEIIEQAPEAAAELAAEATATERARVLEILAADPDNRHLAVLINAIEAGTPAASIFKTLYQEERTFRQTGLKTLADSATPSVGQSRQDPPDTAQKTFFGEVEAAMATHNMTKAQAVRHVQASMPELHATFLTAQKNK